MRKPKNYQYYIAFGNLKKALDLIKYHDDFDLRKYEYSGGTVKDFNDRCRKSFFDSIGLHEEDEEDDKDI